MATIYAALREKLGREPTNAELKADVKRIFEEGLQEMAAKGKLKHQRKGRKNPLPKVTPEAWAIYSKSGSVTTHYTRAGHGKYAKHAFAKIGKAYRFKSEREAVNHATALIDRWPALKQTKLWVQKLPGIRANPSGFSRATGAYSSEIDAADEAFAAFNGYRATKEIKVTSPSRRVGFDLGELVGVVYRSNRAGEGHVTNYHEFKKSSRPHLVGSNGGTLLEIVGGRYEITERGIEDK